MNPEDIRNIVETLLKTGEFLAVKGFELALRKAYFYGAWDLIIGSLFIIAIFTILKAGKSLAKEKKDRLIEAKNAEYTYSGDRERAIGKIKEEEASLVTTVVAVNLLLFAIAINFFYRASYWIYNPELGAIQILVDILRNTIR